MSVTVAVLVSVCAGLSLFLINQMSSNHVLKKGLLAAETEVKELKQKLATLSQQTESSATDNKNETRKIPKRKPDFTGVYRR